MNAIFYVEMNGDLYFQKPFQKKETLNLSPK